MSLSEKSSERKLQLWAPGENTVLAVIAVCFVVLRIVAITILASAAHSDASAASELPGMLSGD